MRLEPSHSWTMNAVMEVPSTERTSHTLKHTHKHTHGDFFSARQKQLMRAHLFPLDESLT